MNKEIDWDNAPEWATKKGYLEGTKHQVWANDKYYSYIADKYHANRGRFPIIIYTFGVGHGYSKNDFKCEHLRVNDSTTKEETKPVYTQEMKDKGELPPIGSMFIDTDSSNNEEVLALAYDFECVVYRAGNNLIDSRYYRVKLCKCEAIDTRTDSEKAFDRFLVKEYSSLTYDSPSDRDFIEDLHKSWKAAIKYTGR